MGQNNYEEPDCTGIEFDYNNNRLSKSRMIPDDKVKKISKSKTNVSDGTLFVRCKPCGKYMDYGAGFGDGLNGRWVCPVCGTKVKERTVYAKLSNENEIFFDEYVNEDEDPMDDYLNL